ncbi:MAG: hypothetical protein WC951_14160 [Bacteroidales bacterium]|jgi:hypothetical protein|nr:hypothetical protein [Paludibacter sp.]MDD4428840.1 hypothetical protein [Paludibacter sp.]
MDFTLQTYQKLLTALQLRGFLFQTFAEYSQVNINIAPTAAASSNPKLMILRHDVDARP